MIAVIGFLFADFNGSFLVLHHLGERRPEATSLVVKVHLGGYDVVSYGELRAYLFAKRKTKKEEGREAREGEGEGRGGKSFSDPIRNMVILDCFRTEK